jgi:hypothetical protein
MFLYLFLVLGLVHAGIDAPCSRLYTYANIGSGIQNMFHMALSPNSDYVFFAAGQQGVYRCSYNSSRAP